MGCDSIVIRNFKIEDTNSTTSLGSEHWEIFPNPTKDILHIQSNQFFKDSTYRIRLMTILGEIILERNLEIVPGRTMDLSLLDIPAGTYIMTIDSENGSIVEKIIIQP